ncbi:alpha/beta fold hydrolase [Micromonospora saelicesensis]|uniref:Pimeloyl-ACP methyl ester carboxylesterase n=1 Tax=Micromonospora saelicesensis TaxID=285676 RepID=A0A1C4X7D1_9ACTN|nr:alpha/beta hydrolase [Micromonospora saelicesensis]SCF04091.1 Pimeloyl-ACP methyl ester carboxylesterase [Micromonospora saelicesensis]
MITTFDAIDGTTLAYRTVGVGDPLVCLPGGPMRDSAYLGDLGGLGAHRTLVILDPRGTGRSAAPADVSTYRCDRMVDDVEALRGHLGLDRLDLLGHSAGANLALQYLTRHPDRVGRLALVNPSIRAVGLEVTAAQREEVTEARAGEPWFPVAMAALESILSGRARPDSKQEIAPFLYGRWDTAAQVHQAAESGQHNEELARIFSSEGAFDPPTTRAALTAHRGPVLLLAGAVDLAAPPGLVARFAELAPRAELVVQPGAGHYPWLDDAEAFTATVAAFLAGPDGA